MIFPPCFFVKEPSDASSKLSVVGTVGSFDVPFSVVSCLMRVLNDWPLSLEALQETAMG